MTRRYKNISDRDHIARAAVNGIYMRLLHERVPALLQQARQGSSWALWKLLVATRDALLERHRETIDQHLRAKGSLADLVEDTIVEAYCDFDQFRGTTDAQWDAWVRQLLFHNLVNFVRKYRETSKRQVIREVPLRTEVECSAVPRRGRRLLTPCSASMAEEWREHLSRAIGRLPEHYRAVVSLR